ncbi:acyl-CoA N-acyltransferase [Rhizopus microsporus var. microsporus]|uniref:Acyl-CoA N-acyltransferase n=2 Tax=Rhizopus microsporus TaxID=58291 RepID=A0A2G4SLS1_RHIZD|nr:acyl-CoA N-acyltransferase [Rhizopus microsporus ATCC 52813]ORE08231.1 acyl-CoA N-acyltransferase [Rhizopus microsporus var. microsporus]PHZ09728.1 acyl-CoA N-acyltransferase [Rhizopus microsporus ATCC 52813]
MPTYSNVRISLLTTPEEKKKALDVRIAVFVHEQKYPLETEIGGEEPRLDEISTHWAAIADRENDDGSIEKDVYIGTVRLIPTEGNIAKLGRLAVLSEARGLYAGQNLVKNFVEYCKSNGYHAIKLHAQYPRRMFYAKLGFTIEEGDDDIFDEDGTPHVRMWMRNLRS